MNKRLLAVFAHPDDEAFGPAGTLALHAKRSVEVHLLCATSGEAGEVDQEVRGQRSEVSNQKSDKDTSGVARRDSPEVERLEKEAEKIVSIRQKELLKSAKILGIAKVEFLGFPDGHLSNVLYHSLADKIMAKIKAFKPQVVVTFDQTGVSGHLDHIAVSMITTYSFIKTRQAKKLYYHCLPDKPRIKEMDDYFIYFPQGYRQNDITTRIDVSSVWGKRIKAVKGHKSQLKDIKRVLKFIEARPKIDYFILHKWKDVKPQFPEDDLFAGIDKQ